MPPFTETCRARGVQSLDHLSNVTWHVGFTPYSRRTAATQRTDPSRAVYEEEAKRLDGTIFHRAYHMVRAHTA